MKKFLKAKFTTLYFFYQYIGFKLFALLAFSFLMVLMDTIGLTMFVPLLKVAEGELSTDSGDNKNMLIRFVHGLFSLLHMEVSVANMLILIVILFLLKGVFSYYALKYKGIVLQGFSQKIRSRLSIGVRDLSYKEFVGTDIGKMQNSLTGESWQVANASSLYLDVIKNILFVLTYLASAFVLDWKFSILVAIGGGLTNLIYQRFYKRTQDLSRSITKNNHRYGAIVIEIINHYKYLKATSRNFAFTNILNKELNQLIKNNIAVAKLGARLSAMREPMMIIVIVAVIAVHVFVFQSTLSSIMVILLLFYRSMQTIMDLQNNWNNYLANTGSIENIKEFQIYLDTHKEVFNGTDDLQTIEEIELKNLSLYYKDYQALDNISLTIKKNQSVAFIGESGSGKTSLVNVICTLLPYDSGSYLINSQSVDTYNNPKFKSKIGYIGQEATVFNADLFDNISFWDKRTPENMVKFEQVIDMCSLRKFYEALPEKENTLLGNNGVNISGGQKQRLSIARELYRDAEILIMDEATSALDSETEREIKESIDLLQGKVTIISIAHRLSTIRHADNIFVMERGRVLEQGSFEELKIKSAVFRKLTELQGM